MKSARSAPSTWLVAAFTLVGLAASMSIYAAQAEAQGRPLLIVPFERENVSDAFFARYMDQIRADATESELFEPLPKVDQPMADLLFAVGCAEPQPDCLTLIGESFGAEVIMYGSVWRNNRQTLHTVNVIDLTTGTSMLDIPIESTFETDDEELLYRKLIGEIQQVFFPYTGKITVNTSEPGAEIFFDGQAVGNTANGPITLTDRALGEHVISGRIGDREVPETVIILHNETPELLIDMSKPPVAGGGIPHLGSYIAFGLGGASLIGGGVFSLLVGSAQGEHDDLADKPTFSEDESKRITEVLSNGSTFTVVQFVLYGIGAAAVTTGAILWFLEGSDDAAPAEEGSGDAGNAFIAPVVSPDGIGAAAGFSF